MKIVSLWESPTPYFTPILNELSRLVDLHVIYMSRAHPLYGFTDHWGAAPEFDYTTHWSMPLKWRMTDLRAVVSCGVSLQLQRLDPDLVLVCSWTPLVLEPLLWARARHRRSLMWTESTQFSGLLRGRLSNALRRLIVSRVDRFVSNGSMATAYLESLDIDPARVVTSRLPSPMFANPHDLVHGRESAAGGVRSPHFLFVGRLIPLKRPLELLRSFASVLRALPHARLTIVGDGVLLPDVVRAAQAYGERVSLLGHVEGDALRAVYASADILVFPSVRDVWGLVVNEALAHGLYVITTDHVGCAPDLLDEGSGRIVPAGDSAAFAEAMIAAGAHVDLDAGGRAARTRRVAGCTPAAFAADICRAAQAAAGSRGQAVRRPGVGGIYGERPAS